MCTDSGVRKIVHEEMENFLKARSPSLLAQSVIGFLGISVLSAIGFNATSLYAMKDGINILKESVMMTQREEKEAILNLIAMNKQSIIENNNRQDNHKIFTQGQIEKIEIQLRNIDNKINGIINTKADDRWRKRDEDADNKHKELQRKSDIRNNELIHNALKKEDENIRSLLIERALSMSIVIEDTKDEIDELREVMQHIKNKAN